MIQVNIVLHNMNISCIYKIKSLYTDKIYIGSAVDFINRKRCHQSDLRKNKHHSILLQRIYNKYNICDLEFTILERVYDKSKLIEREQFYIDELKPHLNILPKAGSSLGNKLSEETKQKLRQLNLGSNNAFFGRNHTEQTKNIISIKKKGINAGANNYFYGVQLLGEKNGMFGKRHTEEAKRIIKEKRGFQITTEETRIKMSKSRLGSNNNSARKIICLNNGKLYDCIKYAADELNVWRQDISKVCKGKLNTTGGYKFKYA